MKTLFKILPFVILASCAPKTKNEVVEKLEQRRDSLQNVILNHEKEINNLNFEIANTDTSNTTDELKLIKKIAFQKNKIVAVNKNVKKLENELASLQQKKKLIPVAIKELAARPLEKGSPCFLSVITILFSITHQF